MRANILTCLIVVTGLTLCGSSARAGGDPEVYGSVVLNDCFGNRDRTTWPPSCLEPHMNWCIHHPGKSEQDESQALIGALRADNGGLVKRFYLDCQRSVACHGKLICDKDTSTNYLPLRIGRSFGADVHLRVGQKCFKREC